MKSMKVLIAYDADEGSREMLVDLQQAGLSDFLQADVVSFAGVWHPNPESIGAGELREEEVEAEESRVISRAAFHRAIDRAREGRDAVQKMFPKWIVTSQAFVTAASWGMLRTVRDWAPDLVVVGSHGHSPLGRMAHRSVGEILLRDSPCSVRIARAPYGYQPGGLRIVLATDGSTESEAAADVVASRIWPAGTVVRVVAVHDHGLLDTDVGIIIGPTAIGFDYDDIEDTRQHADSAVAALRAAGLDADAAVARGNPATVILEMAREWGADAIFMGARGHRLVERLLLGSVSHAVATHAHCSVEVVRVHREPEGRP